MKDTTTTVYQNAWGILGNPTPEKINEYKNLPVGQFRRMVGDLKKKNKGKPLTAHTVWVEKKVTDSYYTSVIVQAANVSQAFDIARSQQDQLVFNEEAGRKDVVDYSYHSYDPTKRWSKL